MQEAVEKITPSIEELTPNHYIKCTYSNCQSVFTNYGNYTMHFVRHHKGILPSSSSKEHKECYYYCPISSCLYNINFKGGKFFNNIKYVRQHYQKVHAAKAICCPNNCGKKFVTPRQLKIHLQNVCGKVYACTVCGWTYHSSEALYTHVKRTQHTTKVDEKERAENNKIAIPQLKRKIQSKVAAEAKIKFQKLKCGYNSKGNLTKGQLKKSQSNEFMGVTAMKINDINPAPCHIKTQTDVTCIKPENQLLDNLSHSEVQTNDEFLSELGLADIQTQTYWSNYPLTHEPVKCLASDIKEAEDKHSCVFADEGITKPSQNSIKLEMEKFQPEEVCNGLNVNKMVQDTLTQTESFEYFPNLNSKFVDIQTQTCQDLLNEVTNIACSFLDSNKENAQRNTETQTEEILTGFFNNFFENSSHIQTQTHGEDFLSELGLADIQTQTCWPSFTLSQKTSKYSVENSAEDVKTEKSFSITNKAILNDDVIISKTAKPHTQSKDCQYQQTQTRGLFDLFGQSSHSYTQTSENFLEELNSLSDIPTETNWKRSESTSCFQDELLVSTETQTSFTQCLLDSCTSMEDLNQDTLNTIYATQYTQTCDALFDNFLTSQDTDLSSGYQSAYTQT